MRGRVLGIVVMMLVLSKPASTRAATVGVNVVDRGGGSACKGLCSRKCMPLAKNQSQFTTCINTCIILCQHHILFARKKKTYP